MTSTTIPAIGASNSMVITQPQTPVLPPTQPKIPYAYPPHGVLPGYPPNPYDQQIRPPTYCNRHLHLLRATRGYHIKSGHGASISQDTRGTRDPIHLSESGKKQDIGAMGGYSCLVTRGTLRLREGAIARFSQDQRKPTSKCRTTTKCGSARRRSSTSTACGPASRNPGSSAKSARSPARHGAYAMAHLA